MPWHVELLPVSSLEVIRTSDFEFKCRPAIRHGDPVVPGVLSALLPGMKYDDQL